MRAVFMRKEPEIDTKEFQVEKVITLPSEQYAYFTQHLMKEHDFIKDDFIKTVKPLVEKIMGVFFLRILNN